MCIDREEDGVHRQATFTVLASVIKRQACPVSALMAQSRHENLEGNVRGMKGGLVWFLKESIEETD